MGKVGRTMRESYGPILSVSLQIRRHASEVPHIFRRIAKENRVGPGQIPERYSIDIHGSPITAVHFIAEPPRIFHFRQGKIMKKVTDGIIVGEKYELTQHGKVKEGHVTLVNGKQYRKDNHGDIFEDENGHYVRVKYDKNKHGNTNKEGEVFLVLGKEGFKEASHGKLLLGDKDKKDKRFFVGQKEGRLPVYIREVVEFADKPNEKYVKMPVEYRKVLTLPSEKWDVAIHGNTDKDGKVNLNGKKRNVEGSNVMDQYVLEADFPDLHIITEEITPPAGALPKKLLDYKTGYDQQQGVDKINSIFKKGRWIAGGKAIDNVFGNGLLCYSEMPDPEPNPNVIKKWLDRRLEYSVNKILAHYIEAESKDIGSGADMRRVLHKTARVV